MTLEPFQQRVEKGVRGCYSFSYTGFVGRVRGVGSLEQLIMGYLLGRLLRVL